MDMQYITRDLENAINEFLQSNSDQIILLSGARQTGKSTLALHLAAEKEKVMVNLWDEERPLIALRHARTFSEFAGILQSVFGFKPDGSRILVIDEAQASEYLSSFIMEMHRLWQGQKVILLGSLLANLYKKGKPLPVGRTVEFVCRPLNFMEFLRFRKKEEYVNLVQGDDYSPDVHLLLMDEYRIFLQIGGLPGMVNADFQGQNLHLLFESFLGNLYRDADRFIEPEDTAHRSRVPQYGRILETVMSAIAHHLAFPTQNATLLSQDSPAYRSILPHVLEALWAWHLAYRVPFTSAQHTTKQGYSSKKYLFDTGMANFLLTKLSPVRFDEGGLTTAMLLENAVLQDCVSRTPGIGAISCYRSNNKSPTELDFVVSHQGNAYPIEVKSSSRVKHQTLHQLLDFLRQSGGSTGYVVYTGMPRTEVMHEKTIRYLPPYKIGEIFGSGDA